MGHNFMKLQKQKQKQKQNKTKQKTKNKKQKKTKKNQKKPKTCPGRQIHFQCLFLEQSETGVMNVSVYH